MKRSAVPGIAVLSTLVALTASAVHAADPIDGIGPVGPIEKVRGDFQFTEGPAWDGKGNLYFTDIPADRIYRMDQEGEFHVFLEPAGHCNGLMVPRSGQILACSMDGRLISINPQTKAVTPLATEYDGARFNAPNDLVVDRAGGIYFTDPHFRAPDPLPQGRTAVYYRAPSGEVTRIITGLEAPNGVILAPDEKTLYVIPSMQKEMFAYAVESPGKISKGRVFCTVEQPPGAGGQGRGGDGLTVDTKGNLYITSGLGLQVFNPAGKLLGIIEFPEQPANVTFGGPDRKRLYVTARTSLYSAPMKSTGHAFPGTDP